MHAFEEFCFKRFSNVYHHLFLVFIVVGVGLVILAVLAMAF